MTKIWPNLQQGVAKKTREIKMKDLIKPCRRRRLSLQASMIGAIRTGI